MKQSEATGEVMKAIAKVQDDLGPLRKDAVNTFHKNRYATLNATMGALFDNLLSQNGLTVIQVLSYHGSGTVENITPVLVTTVYHLESGQWISSLLPLSATKLHTNKSGELLHVERLNPQALGSSITYARRYSLQSLFMMVAEDDDGEGAMNRPASTERPIQTPRQTIVPPTVQPTPEIITSAYEMAKDEAAIKGVDERYGKAASTLHPNIKEQILKVRAEKLASFQHTEEGGD